MGGGMDCTDEDVYAMIDSMVCDTPHADLTFDEMVGDMTETTSTLDSSRYFLKF
jgi:hypothetical protein